MKSALKLLCFFVAGLAMVSCVSKKQFTALQTDLDVANEQLGKCGKSLNDYMERLATCEQERDAARNEAKNVTQARQEQIDDLKEQLKDCKAVRDQQLMQVGELTVLSQAANNNIKETLSQLQKKDKYINLLQAAKTKTDSINLALAVNLKSVLKDGLDDKDIEIMVDKTVVMINLSDKMLFQSGSARLGARANEVLGKIAKIIDARPELEVMVEGYTDNVPISTDCIADNWDLSVKRATAVVRSLQKNFKIDPNRLIAAGRGEYNTLENNATSEGRAINRRTRIIIMPKLDQFYDLLAPTASN
ncbi:MAG TPA: OmpA family protein [Saprospiraceae bacterium]|nr:OmpA family protein [Saprospiraceae bacterium]